MNPRRSLALGFMGLPRFVQVGGWGLAPCPVGGDLESVLEVLPNPSLVWVLESCVSSDHSGTGQRFWYPFFAIFRLRILRDFLPKADIHYAVLPLYYTLANSFRKLLRRVHQRCSQLHSYFEKLTVTLLDDKVTSPEYMLKALKRSSVPA